LKLSAAPGCFYSLEHSGQRALRNQRPAFQLHDDREIINAIISGASILWEITLERAQLRITANL
jgi:hypothetical protein